MRANIPPAPGFLQGLRDLCTQYDICLIFDEVITGFRLALGGAQSHFGITPDLAIFAKAMANGYPISALVGKERWMQPIAEGKVIHAGTMNSGNPTIAAAIKTIENATAVHSKNQLALERGPKPRQVREGDGDTASAPGTKLGWEPLRIPRRGHNACRIALGTRN